MSSHRFPLEGAIGTIRAHDQAAIDHFLLFAERERQRLEAKVIEAEMRCREAETLLVEATLENERTAEGLASMWEELKSERDRAEQMVSERLSQAQAVAHELSTWSEQRPVDRQARPIAATSSWSMPFGDQALDPHPDLEVEDALGGPPIGPDAYASGLLAAAAAGGMGAAGAYTAALDDRLAAAAVFFDQPDANAGWDATQSMPHVHEELLARHPRRTASFQSQPTYMPPAAAAGSTPYPSGPPSAPASPEPQHHEPGDGGQYPDFWQLEQAAATLKAGQLEGTLTALLPMMALVIVLVVVLAWIG